MKTKISLNRKKVLKLLTIASARKVLSYLIRNRKDGLWFLIREGIRFYFQPYLSNLDLKKLNEQFLNDRFHQDSTVFSTIENVTVIVPVYNGLELVKRCISSILNSETNIKIMVVDDCSTDIALIEFYKTMKEDKPEQFDWIKTPTNLGYTGAVNMGLENVDLSRHVVLLNSDTVVGKSFASIMLSAITECPNLASVTPLTNAGAIASVPNILKDFDFFSLDFVKESNEVLRGKTTYSDPLNWPTIPTPVGFCMLITSDARKSIGLFDEIIFARGYGEENDWGERAKIAGFKHVLCPTVFVYHQHGASFGDEKKELLERHTKYLEVMYPNYNTEIQTYIRNDPLKHWRFWLFLETSFRINGNRSNLIFDHLRGGGATITLKKYLKSTAGAINLCVTKWNPSLIQFSIYHGERLISDVETSEFEFRKFLKVANISTTIVNSLTFIDDVSTILLLDRIRSINRECNAKLIINFHDYNAVCPSYNLIDYEGKFCDIPEISDCETCLPRNFHKWDPSGSDIQNWRNSWEDLIEEAEQLVFFSIDSLKRVNRVYPIIDKARYAPHEVQNTILKIETQRKNDPLALRIATIGNLNFAKGGRQLLDFAAYLKSEHSFHSLIHFGDFDYKLGNGKGIKLMGRYQEISELELLLKENQVDAIWIPSIWPETFNLVADEVSESGLPIVTFAFGAPFERFSTHPNFIFLPIKNIELDKLQNWETLIKSINEWYLHRG